LEVNTNRVKDIRSGKMEITEKQVREILKDQKKVFDFLLKLGDAFGDAIEVFEVLDLDRTTKVIWDIYQIPEDDLPDFDPEKEREQGEYDFSTDGLQTVSYNYFEGNLSLDDYINELKIWSEEFRYIYVNQLAGALKNEK
jgi:hypothetical protein